MAASLARLPRFLILEPVSTVRLEMELTRPSCEIDVELQNPEPGRSFLLLIGKKGGPHLQRMSLSGRARIIFDPRAPGVYVLMLSNPQKEPLVLRLRARNLVRRPTAPRSRRRDAHGRSSARGRTPHAARRSGPRVLRPARRPRAGPLRTAPHRPARRAPKA